MGLFVALTSAAPLPLPCLPWCSGRSEGTAEVIYEQAADAERAMRRYNTVQLDGQPMEVRLCWSSRSCSLGGGEAGSRTGASMHGG